MNSIDFVSKARLSNQKETIRDLTQKYLAIVPQNTVSGSTRIYDGKLMKTAQELETETTQRPPTKRTSFKDKSIFDVSISPDWR